MAASTTTTLDLDPDLSARLHRLAEERQSAPQRLMREAIAEYVAREEARARLRADAIASWEDFQATGLHVTHDEVDDWLARLEAGEEVDPPACHR